MKTIVPEVEKIAVFRANGLGDFIFVLPALAALRYTFPKAEITYLGLPWHKNFLKNRSDLVDQVFTVPKYHGIPHETDRLENKREADFFFKAMQAKHFNIAFQMHGGGKHSNPFTQRLGAGLSVGLQAPGAPPLDINVPYFLAQNEILRYLEIVSRIGAQYTTIEPSLPVTHSDKEALKASLGTIDGPYAVLHPGASDIHRRWSPQKFAKVGDMLIQQGLQVYITGSESERKLGEEVVNRMEIGGKNMSGKLSLNGLVALLDGASVVIANDTGPLHLARAVKTPNVGIFWTINAITAGVTHMAKNRMCIAWDPYCPLCGEDCFRTNIRQHIGPCAHETSLVNSITEEEVIDQVLDLLAMYPSEDKKVLSA